MGYDSNKCVASLRQKFPQATLCERITALPYHCDSNSVSTWYHNYCANNDIYTPVQMYYCKNTKDITKSHLAIPEKIMDDCDRLRQQYPNTYVLAQCMCCCSCMAGDTRIATLDGDKAIRSIVEGEQVLAASVGENGAIVWSSGIVDFSQGSGDTGQQPLMVYIALGADGNQDFICTMDQPLMLADGKMTIASKLRPGQQLKGRDGQPVEVRLVSLGSYTGPVHHIGIGTPWKGSVDQHLICAAGLVVGDWDLQTNFDDLPDSLKEADFAALPLLGTADYEKRYGASLQKSEVAFEFSVKGRDSKGLVRPSTFKAYYASSAPLPAYAQKLLSDVQALDVLTHGEQIPFSNPVPQSIFNTVAAQMKGFYPDIDFYYDVMTVEPNIYAFEAYGRKTVVMTGGLGRLQGFGYEGTFMAMAHGAARFTGITPLNSSGYSATGPADGYAFGVIARECWVGDGLISYSLNAYDHWEQLFALISPEHAGGSDPIEDPSISCRLKNVRSAIAGGSLLECAGGAPRPRVAVEQATPSLDGTGVDIVFNVALEAVTANDAANYAFDPAINVKSAKIDERKNFMVHLDVDLAAGQSYTLTVKNLVSVFDTGMDPDRSSAPVSALPAAARK